MGKLLPKWFARATATLCCCSKLHGPLIAERVRLPGPTAWPPLSARWAEKRPPWWPFCETFLLPSTLLLSWLHVGRTASCLSCCGVTLSLKATVHSCVSTRFSDRAFAVLLRRLQLSTRRGRTAWPLGYAVWLANASFEEIDQVVPNVLYLVGASGHTGTVTIMDSLVDDNLDDPSGYISARGVGVLFLEHGDHIERSAAEIKGPVGARVLKNLGIFAQRVDDPRAELLLLAARSLYRSIDDLEGAAAATWMLGAIADDASRYGDAERLYREPLTWLREPRSLAVSHHLVGCTLYHQGRLSEARAAFTRAHQLAPNQDMELEVLGFSGARHT